MSVDRPAPSPAISDSGISQSSRATRRLSGIGLLSSSGGGGNIPSVEPGDFEDIDLGSHDPGDDDKPRLKRNTTDLSGLGIKKSRPTFDSADSAKLRKGHTPKQGSFGNAVSVGGLRVGSPTKSSEGGGSSRPPSRRGLSMSVPIGDHGALSGVRKISRHGRTSSEIERVYDSDDSIPPETVFHNVPVSPSNLMTTPLEISNLQPPSLERPTPGGSDSAVNPTSNFARNPDTFPTSESRINSRRVVSFHEAMSELDNESQRLTRELGKVSLQQPSAPGQKLSEDALCTSSVKPLPELPKPSRRASSHTHLPSTSTLWDPLPVSKEKEAVLSQTRPSWLPPKNKSEEKRHLAEYQRMVQLAEEAEIRRQERATREKEEREQLYEDTSRVWQSYIIPNWNKAIRDPRIRSLWWNGIPSARRGFIWQKCFGNTLMITEDTYRKAMARVSDANYAISQTFQDDDVDAVASLFGRIERDCASVLPELKLFQPAGPLFDDLVNLTKAYSFYRSGFAYIAGSHAIAATLLVNLDPFNAFIALANALNRPLALAFLSGDEMAKYKYYTQFDELFMTNVESLHAYFTDVLQLHPSAYLDRFFKSFFALYMPLDVLARVWDIFVFEGDKILLCTAVAVLLHFEMRLYETQDEVLRTLTMGPWDLGKVDVFIKRIADIREK